MNHFHPSRRQLLVAGAAGLTALALPGRAQAQRFIASGVTPAVSTSNGPVMGLVEEGIMTFKGLRYGAPPIGALRWSPPQKPQPWTEPATAISFGHTAMQLPSGGGAVRYPGSVGPAFEQMLNISDDYRRDDEDCLFLNLWTPGLDNAGRPVMVWFHGGGHNYGSGNWQTTDGHNLASGHDVVVVTVTHRLNAFGYLYTTGLEGGHPSSGNAGALDLVAALQWVHDNVASFGGDPGNVTVFGQSGGGSKVSHTLAMPAADGLRHKAIIQSGSALRSIEPEVAREQTQRLLRAAGGISLAALREVPAKKIIDIVKSMGSQSLGWGPIRDGISIINHPFDPIANPVGRGVPAMIGVTEDEQTLYNVGFDWWGKQTESEMVERLRPQFGDLTGQLVAAAKKEYPNDNPSYLFTDITSKPQFVRAAAQAELKARQPAPVYMYVWEWGAPVEGGMMRAPHTLEIPFAFDNVETGRMFLGTSASTHTLAKRTSTAWTSFARTGNPNDRSTDMPHWPQFEATKRATMFFNVMNRIENDPFSEFRRILAGFSPS